MNGMSFKAAVDDLEKRTGQTYPLTDSLRIWDPANLPNYWVIENETSGEFWMVPAISGGWSKRTPYRGYRESLEPVTGYVFMGLGVPLRRPWAEVCRDSEGRN